MTQFKGRARTRPTNSQHLPTHSKERKQQERNKLCSQHFFVLQTHSSRTKSVQGTLHNKRQHLSHQPFYLCKGGAEQQKASWWGGANQGQVLKIKVQRAQPVHTSWGSLTSEGWEPHQEMADLSPCKGPTSGITCANVEEITRPDGMIWHGSSSFHTGLSWHLQEIFICCGFYHLLWQLMALNRLPCRQAQEVPIF